MINHISVAVNDPKHVASVLAEIWDGVVYPFPPSPGAYLVLADDGRGTTVEVTTAGTVIVPGEGLPPEEEFAAGGLHGEVKEGSGASVTFDSESWGPSEKK